MRKAILIVLILLVAGGAAAYFLLHVNEEQVALHSESSAVRDTMTGEAGKQLAVEDAQKAYDAGDRSFGVVNTLARHYAANERLPEAVTMAEEFSAGHADDVEGKRLLAELYGMAQRPADQLRILEQLAGENPSESDLVQLASLYNQTGNYAKQEETLNKLIAMSQEGNPNYLADLAAVQQLQGKTEPMRATLTTLRSKHPDYRSYTLSRVETIDYTEQQKPDEAFASAEAWATQTTATPAEIADLGNILHYSASAELALKLLQPRETMRSDPAFFTAYVNALIGGGDSDRAYALMQEAFANNALPSDCYAPLLTLALQRNDEELVLRLAEQLDVAKVSEDMAIDLLELARNLSNQPAFDALHAKLGDAAYTGDKPVLRAYLAIVREEENADETVAASLNTEMNDSQKLRFAGVCANEKKISCFETLAPQLKAVEAMTPAEVNTLASVYIAADQPQKIYAPVEARHQQTPHVLIETALLKLQAALNKEAEIASWLDAKAQTAPTTQLSELFYLANDRGHAAVASRIAEILYQRDDNTRTRDMLISAYLRSGNAAKALPLLRPIAGESRANEDNYLAALTAAAKTSGEARTELQQYALAQLRNSDLDTQRRIQFAYVLINQGGKNLALPVIQSEARNGDKEWRKLYDALTGRNRAVAAKGAGGVAAPAAPVLTAEQRYAMGMNPQTQEGVKREMAFSLLNEGNKDMALPIFAQLASGKPAQHEDTRNLLYLWGPRLNAEQIAWVSERAQQSEGAERREWEKYVTGMGDDYALMNYVTDHPETLDNPAIRDKYLNAMAANGSRDTYVRGLEPWLNVTQNPDALRDYAKVAQSYGYRDAAVGALKRADRLAPNNPKVAKDLGVLTYGQSSYGESKQYLQRLEQPGTPETASANGSLHSNQPSPTALAADETAEAYFYKAALARRDNDRTRAAAYYKRVVELSRNTPTSDTSALTRLYSSYFHLGNHAAGRQGFEQLLAAYPGNKGILADYMSILIEYKYYDDAAAIANRYDRPAPAGAPLSFATPGMTRVQTADAGRSMVIGFNGEVPAEVKSQLAAKDAPWVASQESGHDAMLIAAKPGYTLRFTPVSETVGEIVPAYQQPGLAAAQAEIQRQQDLRLQLLYARIEMETGRKQEALARLNAIEPQYPNDPQLMGYTANAENVNGNWGRALSLLDNAQRLSPQNEDIASLKRGIERVYGQHVFADYEWKRTGNSDELIGTVGGMVRPTPQSELGLILQNNELDASGVRYPDGFIGDREFSRQRGELYGAYNFDNGMRLQASLFANDDTLGGGGYFSFNNPLGRSEILAEYHRPYWDFVEAVADNANRDRVGVRHVASLTDTTSMAFESSLNRYNIEEENDVAETVLVRASIVQQLRALDPYIAIGYGFDGEYMLDEKKRVDTNNIYYRTLPLVSREIHFLSGIFHQDFTDDTRGDLVAGWAFDRLGNNGPQVEARLGHDITEDLEAQLRARYGLQTNDSDNTVMAVGGQVRYKF